MLWTENAGILPADEKTTMQDLNSRLASYLDKVQETRKMLTWRLRSGTGMRAGAQEHQEGLLWLL